MEIANDDIAIVEINSSINNANAEFVKKFKEMKRTKDENKLLNVFYSDYLKHYDYIVNEKIKTKSALINIFKHLENLQQNNDITNEQLKLAKNEQLNVLNKIHNVKNELDDIMYS